MWAPVDFEATIANAIYQPRLPNAGIISRLHVFPFTTLSGLFVPWLLLIMGQIAKYELVLY